MKQTFTIVKSDGSQRIVSEKEFQAACDEVLSTLTPEELRELQEKGKGLSKVWRGMNNGKD